MNSAPELSLLIAYRNRSPEAVARCLASLHHQTLRDFEIIFVDYGSDQALQQEVKKICSQYPQIQYFYTDTRGWFWNKSHALNLAYGQARGRKIMVVDVDLIFAPRYLEKALSMLRPTNFVCCAPYYLLENLDNLDRLSEYTAHPQRIALPPDESAVGNILVSREAIESIGGWDEYYRVWGGEDRDLVQALEARGFTKIRQDFADARVFHQWHVPNHLALPKGWMWHYEQYLQARSQRPPYRKELAVAEWQEGFFLTLQDRPALQAVLAQQSPSKTFTFEYPKEQSWAKFAEIFTSLASGESILVKQTFDYAQPNPHARGRRLVAWLNSIFAYFQTSYRLTDVRTYDTEYIHSKEVTYFLFYFILHWESHILDYYFDTQAHTITFWVIKR